MYLSQPPTLPVRHKSHCISYPSVSASSFSRPKTATEGTIQNIEGIKERIRNLFNKVDISVSSYDTAWVAMVPSPHYSMSPCFPECLDWLLDNQLGDGSWGWGRLPPQTTTPLLLKDNLSSTLASILALKRWGVGQSHINKGLHFMELNFPSAIDKNQHSPIGFDIIFPGMLDYAKDLDLKLPLEPTILDAMLRNREMELKRCYESQPEEREKYLAYISEGIGKSQDWEMVMKYQRKNGSLFNSPATTAAALTHHLPNSGCLNYIRLLLDKFGNAVPTSYPLDIYVRLCMIDNLERLGIDWHFRDEIQGVLDETYSCWLQGDEQIFMDVATCALAFRLLRINKYDVSSDPLTRIAEEDCYFDSLGGGHLKGMIDVLELYRASQMIISPHESMLRKQNSKSSLFLEQTLSDDSLHSNILARYISQEVDDALKFPLCASLERMASRRNIEHYNVDSMIRVLKTSYCSSNIGNKDFIKLAVEDFNICQSMHREEIGHLERWVIEKRLDKLKFARQKSAYSGFSAAATIFTPELADARMAWAKGGVLTTVTDDFFDIAGSPQELLNLVHLFEKWDVNIVSSDYCSEEVGIIFSAIHDSITEIADKAFIRQGRDVTSHLVEIWLDLLKAWLREAEWTRNSDVPTLDEYFETAYIGLALGPIVLPPLYFVGPQLSEEAIHSSEMKKMFEHMSACGRLLNDIQTFKIEVEQGKLNAISLLMINGTGMTKEEAIEEAWRLVESHKEEMLSLYVKEKGSLVPRACKELFWQMTKVMHQFYINEDGFTLQHMMKVVKDIIYEPILVALP